MPDGRWSCPIAAWPKSIAAFLVALFAVPVLASAQTDEIQVYDGGLAPVGTFNLTVHSNFTPKGLATPAFPGAVVADKSFNGVPEWALGVTRWFEAGLYLPVYSRDNTSGFGLDGFKLRAIARAASRIARQVQDEQFAAGLPRGRQRLGGEGEIVFCVCRNHFHDLLALWARCVSLPTDQPPLGSGAVRVLFEDAD